MEQVENKSMWFDQLEEIRLYIMATKEVAEHGKWKLLAITETEAIDEEFELFNFSGMMRISDLEDIGLDGRWRYV